MALEIKELDVDALRKEILYKCKKEPEYLASRTETKDHEYRQKADVQEEDILSMKTDEVEEMAPFEDILAEKRREYTAKEEFIYSLYNSVLPAFVIEWNGYFLRKRSLVRESSKDDTAIIEEGEGDEEMYHFEESDEEKEKEKDETPVPSWKLSLPDEFANIKFYTNNTYSGRISRKMMEGEGMYTWYNGVQYKGEFEQNQIRGKGLLKWNDNYWYEGDFVNGFRHGRGIMTDKARNRTYVGQWRMGHMEKKVEDNIN